MNYCGKCEMEFVTEDGCLYAVYRVLMRDGHYRSVPPLWIENCDEPLLCDSCQSGYQYGSACKCGKVRALA